MSMQMFSATAVAQPEHQQLELADCSVSSGASLVASRDSAAASGDAATPVDTVADKGEWDDEEEALPELTPDIARLLPQKPGASFTVPPSGPEPSCHQRHAIGAVFRFR